MNTWTQWVLKEGMLISIMEEQGGEWPTYGYFHVAFVILGLVYMMQGRDLVCSLIHVKGNPLRAFLLGFWWGTLILLGTLRHFTNSYNEFTENESNHIKIGLKIHLIT